MDIRYDKNYITADDTILSFTHDERIIHIPAVINEHDIRRIGMGAFKGNYSTTDITIEEGIQEIGRKAFASCSKLRNVSLPRSLKSVEDDTFFNCDLANVSFWLKIPYNKYMSVREGSIKLTDGRYIFDPQNLGEEMARLIKILMPDYAKGKFRADLRMGCLFSDFSESNNRNSYIFEKYCTGSGIDPNDLVYETDAIGTKIRNKDADIWFDHNDEYDDSVDRQSGSTLDTLMLFLVEEGLISDRDIYLKFVLTRNRYFFQRAIRINCNGSTYYCYVKEYFTNDDKHPYFRVSTTDLYNFAGCKIACEYDVLNKYLFLQDLI